MRFGDYLKSKRKLKSVTQEDLANYLEVSSVYIHQLETGKVDAPSLERCEQLASILEINIRELWNVAKRERLKRFMHKEDIIEQNLEVLTDEEKLLIRLYRSLDEEMRKDFSGMIFMLLRHSQNEDVQKVLEEFMKCG
ncbi:MAG: helix-turn-helix domain-containing protein [Candidatus Dadabacteria bacterium]|nr:helix-turn-helix domain-containing protein [Candidatus Dadabacteria bacterium]NIQ13525.1 helix-turn-helix domain-containing protein [Candidatus Dadabacteria bacterium]